MKSLICFIALVLSAFLLKAQYPILQNIGGANTLVQSPSNGGLRANLINRTYSDTTAANLGYSDSYAGAQIFTTSDGFLWIRNAAATGWLKQSQGGGSGTVTGVTATLPVISSGGTTPNISLQRTSASDSLPRTALSVPTALTNASRFYTKVKNGDSVRIACEGTSITSGYLATNDYPHILDSLLNLSGYKSIVYNRGFPGDQTVQGISRWASSDTVDICMLEYGVNDMFDYGGYGYTQTLNSYKANMRILIERRLKQGSWVIPLLPSPLQNSTNNNLLNTTRAVIIELAKEYGLFTIDLAVAETYFSGTTYWSDGVHVTNPGNIRLGQVVADFVLTKPKQGLIQTVADATTNFSRVNTNYGGLYLGGAVSDTSYGVEVATNFYGVGGQVGTRLLSNTQSSISFHPFAGLFVDRFTFTHYYQANGGSKAVFNAPDSFSINNNIANLAVRGNVAIGDTTFSSIYVPSNSLAVQSQIGVGTNTPVTSAIGEFKSTTKGLLIPRMTTAQKNAISSPATSLLVFDLSLGDYYYYSGAAWLPLSATPTWQQTLTAGSTLTTDNTVDVGGNDLRFLNAGETEFSSLVGGLGGLMLISPSSVTLTASGYSRTSDFNVFIDSLRFRPGLGNLLIDTLNAQSNASDSMLVWAASGANRGKVGYRAIPSSGGSSLFPTTGTGTATGNIVADMASNTVTVTHTTAGSATNAFRPYKVYSALLTQSGTSPPTAQVLENTLGGTVTFSYTGAGDYKATLTGAWTANKTAVITGVLFATSDAKAYRISADDIRITVLDGDDYFEGATALLIHVYY